MTLEEQILETATHQCGNLIKIINIKPNLEAKLWSMYVRLPSEYHNILQNKDARNKISSKKVQNFLQLFTSDDFLKSKRSIDLTISKDKVKIETHNDGFTNASLKISSNNLKIVLDIRNFLSNLIYSAFAEFGPGKELVSYSFYFTVQNLQTAVREYLNDTSNADITHLIEQFERKIIGALPV